MNIIMMQATATRPDETALKLVEVAVIMAVWKPV